MPLVQIGVVYKTRGDLQALEKEVTEVLKNNAAPFMGPQARVISSPVLSSAGWTQMIVLEEYEKD